MDGVIQASALPGEAKPGTLLVNPKNPLSTLNRHQRRALESETAKAERKLSSAEQEIIKALGFEPDAEEVADLIDRHLVAGLINDADQSTMQEVARKLRSGAGHSAAAYAVLVNAVQRGPFANRALDLLEQMYGPDAVIELRAVSPTGGAHSFNGRLGHERTEMAEFIRKWNGSANVYFGINPRKPEFAGTAHAGNADDIANRQFVVLDLDNKDAPDADREWSRTITAAQAHDPAMIIHSGNGHHVWFANQPVEGDALVASAVPLAKSMAAVGADNMASLPQPIRLPSTINIPTGPKRDRGNTLALALVVTGFNPSALRHECLDLSGRFHNVARAQSLPGKQPANGGGAGSNNGKPQELLQAPSAMLLQTLLALLPNDENVTRDEQVAVAHAAKGASLGTEFEADARDCFLDWSARYGASDANHDAKQWDGIRDPHTGFSNLMAMLNSKNPAGFEQMSALLAPVRAEAARVAFKDQPIDPTQVHLIADPDPKQTVITDGPEPNADETKGDGRKREPPHEAAMRALSAVRAEFFRDHTGRIWIKLAGRLFNIGSIADFLQLCGWLAAKGIMLTGTARTHFKEAVEIRASVFNNPPREVHYRQVSGGDPNKPEAFVNLMDGQGMGVRVFGSGWTEAPTSTFPHEMADRSKARPLPKPVRANDGVSFIDRWAQHVPVAPVQNASDLQDLGVQQCAIWICFLLSQFYRPGGAPHLLFAGHQGAGKTTTARRVKALTDPDSADVLASLPSDETAIYSIASQQANMVIDNVSSIRSEHSDVACALYSGTAYQKRQLYTDGERAVFQAKTSLMFTSINDDMIKREDLMDRTLILNLPRLDPVKRKTEADMNEAWERDLPALFAGVLDLLSGALAKLPAVRVAASVGFLPTLPRFADAAMLAEAACQSMGWKPGLCIEALNAARRSASADQLENNPAAFRVRELIQKNGGSWSGTAKNLLTALGSIDGPDWGPRRVTPSSLTGMLNRAAVPMEQVWGIKIKRDRAAKQRTIEITGPVAAGGGDA